MTINCPKTTTHSWSHQSKTLFAIWAVTFERYIQTFSHYCVDAQRRSDEQIKNLHRDDIFILLDDIELVFGLLGYSSCLSTEGPANVEERAKALLLYSMDNSLRMNFDRRPSLRGCPLKIGVTPWRVLLLKVWIFDSHPPHEFLRFVRVRHE